MKKLKMHSPDFTEENIEKLATLFPNCVSEAVAEDGSLKKVIDFGQLKQELANAIVAGPKEHYCLNWPGKRESLLAANAPIAKTLRPIRSESVAFDTTENLFIEGGNLDALKLLQETYLGKVKMIYIDPPYNTGKDFIYKDNYAVSTEDYQLETSQKDKNGNRLVANLDSNGRFHSDWLSMMYPRLKRARGLLKDDGVIFISIDDNEQANLKVLCDEIFSEENFVCCFNWNTTKGAQGMQRKNRIVPNHEYILVYAKNSANFSFLGENRTEAGFNNPDNDPRGPWKRQYLQRLGQNLPIRRATNPENGMTYEFETPYTQENIDLWISEDRIIFPQDKNGYPSRKEFLKEYKTLKQIVTHLGLYATKSSTECLYNIFDGCKVFTNPKPDKLLRYLCSVTLGQDDLLLDFFAGSATTAHAVMQLNADDGGRRKFICIQLPEACAKTSEAFKAGYQTIAEIAKERIRRAGKKINQATGTDVDAGFRVLKVDSSNMKDIYYSPDEYSQGLLAEAVDNIKGERTPEDLLFQVLLDWGVALTLPIVTETIAGCAVFFVDTNALAVCFEEHGKITEDLCKKLAERQPLRVVFRDSGFKDDSVKINVEQLFKLLSPDTDMRTI